MKRLANVLLVTLFIWSCENSDENLIDPFEKLKDTLNIEAQKGEVEMFISEKGQIGLTIKESNTSKYKQTVISNIEGVSISGKYKNLGDCEYIELSDMLILYSNQGNFIFLIGVYNEAHLTFLNSLKNEFGFVDSQIKYSLGNGISYQKGSYININDYNILQPIHEQLIPNLDSANGKRVDGECTSGGPGASTCSITEVFGIKCSVTCRDGYYACCKSSTTTCVCVKEGGGSKNDLLRVKAP